MGDHEFHKVRGDGDIPRTIQLVFGLIISIPIHICTLVTLIMLVTQPQMQVTHAQLTWDTCRKGHVALEWEIEHMEEGRS